VKSNPRGIGERKRIFLSSISGFPIRALPEAWEEKNA